MVPAEDILTSVVSLVNSTHIDDKLLKALVCADLYPGSNCTSICPNQDLAGIGVRVAFYFQSFVNALLVVFSPSDSLTTAWAGALLTSGIVVAAFVQKARGALTLHHATLVLDFATLACIGSLAAAPTLPIWRMTPEEYYEHERKRHAITVQQSESPSATLAPVCETDIVMNFRKAELNRAQKRARIVLSIALLLQVLSQWSWAISLFVWWRGYSQPNCNQKTQIVMFFGTFTVGHHNNLTKNGAKFLIWPIWLLFNVAVTLVLTLILVLTSRQRAQQIVPTGAISPYDFKEWGRAISAVYKHLGASNAARFLLLGDISFFVLWAMFIASSEKQQAKNNLFEGDNDFGGFGQITALCVSLAPIWSIAVALYKYPARRHSMRRTRAVGNVTAASAQFTPAISPYGMARATTPAMHEGPSGVTRRARNQPLHTMRER